jgi:hypothetical protein
LLNPNHLTHRKSINNVKRLKIAHLKHLFRGALYTSIQNNFSTWNDMKIKSISKRALETPSP